MLTNTFSRYLHINREIYQVNQLEIFTIAYLVVWGLLCNLRVVIIFARNSIIIDIYFLISDKKRLPWVVKNV